MPRARSQQVSLQDTPYCHCTFLCREYAVFVGRFYVEKIRFLVQALSTAVAGLKSVCYS
ncbi:hypothetical protein MSP8886_04355 [Marinomonas spartinae]|uniref:Uncharacterized protein n=1 Tax=Marinomonas spartinae TaxID=1792290 RepID=A0A1A8TVB9_9GAMM|nr:hypothetical protein MSP8886_04355 [Marinomonas spartinae]